MKSINCKKCGANLEREDNFFVCKQCGEKYTIEQAREIMLANREKQAQTEESIPENSFAQENNQFDQQTFEEGFYIGATKVDESVIAKIDSLLANGNKIEAIKIVKETANLGLVVAKTWTENYKNFDITKPQIINDRTNEKTGGCYVATCVYGSYDCPEVWTLRRYRDNTLGSTWYGRAFIKLYYAISPTLVKWFGHAKWFKKMWKGKLDKMVKKLQDSGVENTPYQDKNW